MAMIPSAALLAATMAWVSTVTGLPPAPLVPTVVFTSRTPDGAALVRVGDDRGVWGATLPDHIYLAPGWDASRPEDMAVLAHEMTHDLQFAAHRHYRCTAEMERLAYYVQDYYLAEHGIDFWQQTRYMPVTLSRVTECP